jgi:bifunctional DNA-binding transcriptional regulator/antitoxin component of YhaV-PrlF toxin-antitoxin module
LRVGWKACTYYPKFLNVAPAHLARQTDIVNNAVLPYNIFMSTLTVTSRGQVTFRKKVMEHLGVKPGGKIELDLLPDGRGVIKAARPSGRIEDFFGVLAGQTKKVATIEEMNQAAADGWAGRVKMGRK